MQHPHFTRSTQHSDWQSQSKPGASHTGFTLVEMAIVLVIIGIILGMAFKGRDLIDGAKVKSIGAQLNRISAALNIYQERYNVLPGDGCPANSGGNALCVGRSGANGSISSGVESAVAWTQLTTTTGILSANDQTLAIGQRLSFWADASSYPVSSSPAPGIWVATMDSLFGASDARYLCALDLAIDDGLPQTGNIRSSSPNGAAYPNSDCWQLNATYDYLMKL